MTLAGENQPVTLILEARNYTIARGQNRAYGAAGVLGNQLVFLQSNLCSGTGAYTWTLTDNSLRFTMIGDPCPGRSEVLHGATYIKGTG